MSKLLEIEGIGSIEIRDSQRCKRIKLSVKPDGKVHVVAPIHHSVTTKKLEGFVLDHADWILKQQAKISQQQTLFDTHTDFHTFNHQLNITLNERATKGQAAILKDEIRIVFPTKVKFSAPRVQQFIRTVIETCMRDEAKLVLPAMVKEYATKHQLCYNRVSVKNAKTRWGSCSSKKNINLNLQLMRLPKRLITYVVLHELAHTKEMNHSPSFWKLLERICPNAKQLDKELSKYHTEIY